MSSETVTILGAGLAGSLLAIYLARRGYAVQVIEARPDMRDGNVAAGRSINLALANRGIRALREVGLYKSVSELLITMRGRRLHDLTGAPGFQPYGKNDDEVIYSVSRGGLNELLLNTAEQQYGVRFDFSQRVLAANLAEGSVRLGDKESGREYVLETTPIIAADGAGSIVRRQMSKLPGYQAREDYLSHAYKELTIPAGDDGKHQIDKNALHIWPRGDYMLIALPNLDGSFTVTLFLPRNGSLSFESLSTATALTEFFKQQFPDALALIPDLKEQFFGNPTGSMVTVYCQPWRVDGKFLLIGDAAHSIVPFHGQGMNAAFEDCYEFDRCLENKAPGIRGWSRVFADFEARRKPNADAIAAMALENYVEMRDSVRSPRFQLKKQLAWELEKRFPDSFVPRYSLVMFHHVAYHEAQQRGIIQQKILEKLLGTDDSLDNIDYDKASLLIQEKLSG